jgi:CTP-dependent riboflavin kinase
MPSDPRKRLVLHGRVISGKGIAAERMRRKTTEEVFKPLNMHPYPGTLNIFIGDDPHLFFNNLPHTECRMGRKHYKGRFHGKIGSSNSVPVWVLLFEGHAEVMAKINLREAFDLRDDDEVEITFRKG